MKAAIKCVKNFAYYRIHGAKIRRVEDPAFTHCFFVGHSLYVVYENPRTFPPLISKSERQALIEFARHDGNYAHIGIVQVENLPPEPPKVIRTKNLPDYNYFYYPRLGP